MWRRQNLLFLLCTSLDWLTRVVGVIHVFGYEGRDVAVPCAYSSGYESYEKYLCKNDCGDADVLITTSEQTRDRFSISEDESTKRFTVTISKIRSSDPLRYWCGVTRSGSDLYTEVKLRVSPDSCCDDVVTMQSHEDVSVSIGCPYDPKYRNHLKYICRGRQPSTCLQQAVITSENSSHGRFRLTDSETLGKFTVTISMLVRGDAGPYLCGVKMNSGLDVFSSVQLEVNPWCCLTSSNVTAIVGQTVTLQCPYPPQHQDNRKFLCKGDHRNNCTEMVTLLSRFTLQDDTTSSSFLVTVSQLEAGDTGTYWCGSDSLWGVENYTMIHLSVFLQLTSTPTSTFTAETVRMNSTDFHGNFGKEAVLSVVFGVLAALVILTLSLVYKYKCHRGQDTKVIKHKMANKVEEMSPAELYSNQDVVQRAKTKISKQQSAGLYDDIGENQPHYGNFVITEEIYCNQSFHHNNMR